MENPFSASMRQTTTLHNDRQECLCYLQSFTDRLKHSLDFNVHTDPFRAGAAMTICTAVDIDSFNADINRAQTAVAPPFRGTKKADDGRTGGDSQMRRSRVSTH